MSDRYKGGILSGTAPTVTQQGANGVYTLSQQMQYQGQGLWPIAAQNPILNSLRFRASASAYLSRTPASATNQRTWTYSAWVKRAETIQNDNRLFGAGTSDSNRMTIFIENWIGIVGTNSGSNVLVLNTTPIYRDPAAWYHVVVAVDTTQATSSDRVKVYVNGTQVTSFTTATYPAQNTDLYVNSTATHVIGTRGTYAVNSQFDGQMAAINFIDGLQLTPSSFGTTDADGIWQPIPYTGAYGTNGFYLPFSDIALTSGSNAGLGKDFSGNGNYWNTNNISVTAGATYDAMLDSPSNANSTIANYPTLNPLDWGQGSDATFSYANLRHLVTNTTGRQTWSTMAIPTTGKWYFEVTYDVLNPSQGQPVVAVGTADKSINTVFGLGVETSGGYLYRYTSGAVSSYTTVSAGDTFMFAIDRTNQQAWIGKNGTWLGSGNPSGGTNPAEGALLTTGPYLVYVQNRNNSQTTFNFGQQPFAYTPPTGFNRINTYNLPVPTIPAGNKLMDATLWTGNGSTQTITNTAGFYPDFTWIKQRSNTTWHNLYDSVRGATYALASNDTGGTDTRSTGLTAFNSNGFSLGSDNNANGNTNTYVGWQWNAEDWVGVAGVLRITPPGYLLLIISL